MTTGRVEFINPEGLNRNPAFTNVVVVSGPVRTIYVGGQDAVTAEGEVVGRSDLAAQTEQVLVNLQTALAAAGAGPEHVIKWNLLVVDGARRTLRCLQMALASSRWAPPVKTTILFTRICSSGHLVISDQIQSGQSMTR